MLGGSCRLRMPPWNSCGRGYCGLDMVGTLFRVVKFEPMDEALKLEFVKAPPPSPPCAHLHGHRLA